MSNSVKLAKILQNLERSQKILILTHQDPDPDAYGSTRSLQTLLESQGKQTELIYVYHNHKARKKPNEHITIYQRTARTSKPRIDLSRYDYALCLDTSYSDHNITGLKFKSQPRHGIGTIDHHSRSDTPLEPEQDYNLPQIGSTCEIIYQLTPEILGYHPLSGQQFSALSPDMASTLANLLTPGILDDMVGLTITEKLTSENLTMLEELKSIVGETKFKQMLRKSRTLRLPPEIAPLARKSSHYLISDKKGDKFHVYYLEIPANCRVRLGPTRSSVVALFEHYARTSCERNGWTYGMFIMTIDQFEPGMTKFSARGPLIKPLFQPPPLTNNLFRNFGISGSSAMGGRFNSDLNTSFEDDFIQLLKESAATMEINLPKISTELRKRLADLVEEETAMFCANIA